MQKRSFGARRCGDDRDSTSILRGNGRAEDELDQLEASSLNVSKAAGQGEMERKKIKVVFIMKLVLIVKTCKMCNDE